MATNFDPAIFGEDPDSGTEPTGTAPGAADQAEPGADPSAASASQVDWTQLGKSLDPRATPESVMQALQHYQELTGPEAEERVDALVEEKFQERSEADRKEWLSSLFRDPSRVQQLVTVLNRLGYPLGGQPAAPQQAAPPQFDEEGNPIAAPAPPQPDPRVNQILAHVASQNAKIQALEKALQKAEGIARDTQETVSGGAEFDEFLRRFPQAMRVADKLAAAVTKRLKADPAYRQRGGVFRASQEILQEWSDAGRALLTQPPAGTSVPGRGFGGAPRQTRVRDTSKLSDEQLLDAIAKDTFATAE